MVHSGRDAHLPPERASDALGYPALRVAHSRKVQKGEDFSFAVPDARWVVPGDDASSDPKRAVHFSAFGLFDGHGGKDCAAHCASETLPALLAALDRLGPVPRDVDPEDAFEARLPAALAAAFATLDAAFLARDIHSGATATVVVVCGRCVTTAAVGDSLATLDCTGGGPKGSKGGGGSGGGGGDPHHHPPAPPHKLSPEHRLDTSASERERVLAAGAEVRATAFEDGRPVGPLRVWPGGLAVSRSIGDRDGKRGGGVISEPEVTRVVVPDEQPGFRIVLASDGLWDAATVKQSQRCSGRCATGAAAAALCKLAREQKDNRDDITVVVIDALADPEHKDPFSQRRAPWRVDVDVRAVWPEEQQRREQRREEGSSSRAPPPPSERRRLRAEAKAAEEAVTAAEDDRGGTPEVGGPTEAAFSAKPATDASTKNRSEKNDSASLDPADDGGGWEEVGAAQKSHRPNRRGGGLVLDPPPKGPGSFEGGPPGSEPGAKKRRNAGAGAGAMRGGARGDERDGRERRAEETPSPRDAPGGEPRGGEPRGTPAAASAAPPRPKPRNPNPNADPGGSRNRNRTASSAGLRDVRDPSGSASAGSVCAEGAPAGRVGVGVGAPFAAAAAMESLRLTDGSADAGSEGDLAKPPATPAKKEKRKGKRERAAERAAKEAAAEKAEKAEKAGGGALRAGGRRRPRRRPAHRAIRSTRLPSDPSIASGGEPGCFTRGLRSRGSRSLRSGGSRSLPLRSRRPPRGRLRSRRPLSVVPGTARRRRRVARGRPPALRRRIRSRRRRRGSRRSRANTPRSRRASTSAAARWRWRLREDNTDAFPGR